MVKDRHITPRHHIVVHGRDWDEFVQLAEELRRKTNIQDLQYKQIFRLMLSMARGQMDAVDKKRAGAEA